jgi:hypothetical protein
MNNSFFNNKKQATVLKIKINIKKLRYNLSQNIIVTKLLNQAQNPN